MSRDLRRQRLLAQQIAIPRHDRVADVVRDLLCVQAQDYLGSLWAIALRTVGGTTARVEQAIADRAIVRSWPMRGTLHLVAAEDLRWLLALLGDRAIASARGRMTQLGLGDREVAAARDLLGAALSGGRALTRAEVYAAIAPVGVEAGTPGLHIINHLATRAFICHGPLRGRQPTFVLVDEWLPPTPTLDRADALAALVERYFTSHGPATVHDLAWWAGLTLADIRLGLASTGDRLERWTIDGTDYWAGALPEGGARLPKAHLLPGFDEYLLGYRDRSAVLDDEHAGRISPGANGVFHGSIVVDGRVTGTWRRTIAAKRTTIVAEWFAPPSAAAVTAVERAARGYGAAHGVTTVIEA